MGKNLEYLYAMARNIMGRLNIEETLKESGYPRKGLIHGFMRFTGFGEKVSRLFWPEIFDIVKRMKPETLGKLVVLSLPWADGTRRYSLSKVWVPTTRGRFKRWSNDRAIRRADEETSEDFLRRWATVTLIAAIVDILRSREWVHAQWEEVSGFRVEEYTLPR